ncbi:hypothetical protein INT45_010578 [Circinella minor]|uniref:Uncharacterized protein n=1 Tax=Circinella minor TaxID=1195481 RepID=A0A8H7RMF3_9FUNG|nr:hypothetical protein INT45_010578 [Circinella minor]
MANFVAKRDALKAMTRITNTNNNTPPIPSPPSSSSLSLPLSSYSLKSPIKKKYIIDEVATLSAQLTDLDYLLQAYLDDEDLVARGVKRGSQKRRSKMPSLESIPKIKIFQLLSMQDYDEDGDVYEQNIHANLNYFGRQQQDYILLKTIDEGIGRDEVDDDENDSENDDLHVVSQVFLFFKLLYKGSIIELALVQTYPYLRKKKHPSGLHVLGAPEKMYKDNQHIIRVEDIKRTALVVPNNGSESTTPGVPYHEYLVLHDIDRDCWRRFRTYLPSLPRRKYIGWKKSEP